MDTVAPHAAQMMGTPYCSINGVDVAAAVQAMGDPLSGYLAGKERGGKWVCMLEDAWAETFQVKHAIACNSNTSGLMAAAFAVGLKPGDHFAVSAMTMSATAAAPMFTGASPVFFDVDDKTFNMNSGGPVPKKPKAIFVTNLFGHPAKLAAWRKHCDNFDIRMIEDNAQAPFAMEKGKYAGTIGHIGVFSLNVHKHFQCGEGGIIVTDDDLLAARMRAFINHGEHRDDFIGLNLRMPEVCAAIALRQLRKGLTLVEDRRQQAETIIGEVDLVPGFDIRPPVVREECTHSFYCIPFLIERNRAEFCAALRAHGVPVIEGYQEPLYRMPAFWRMAPKDGCPIAEDLQDRRLFYIENCAWTFSKSEIKRIGDAFRKAAEQCLIT